MIIILATLWFIIWFIIIVCRYRQEILSSWQEPVLKRPVLIFESDDWGAGPLNQAEALGQIISILTRHYDKQGHHPVMTLGVILSIPDAKKIKATEYKTYSEKRLDDFQFEEIKEIMLKGLEHGIFDLQLHGMAHYWPDNLMYALQSDGSVRAWLNEGGFLVTEALPSMLQSRWTDTKKLPTTALKVNEVRNAVKEEVNAFMQVFDIVPVVAVPPTFIWSAVVENCWYEQSIKYLVTPGQCFNKRNHIGLPSSTGQKIFNGQKSESGLTYIVRNDFFEPGLGHTAEMAVNAMEQKSQLAQPTLLEIHRTNFIQDNKTTKLSLEELERTIVLALEKYPDLIFISTKELADIYVSNKCSFVETSTIIRLGIVMDRVWGYQAIRKWLYVSALFIPFLCLKTLLKKSCHQKTY